MAEAEKRRTGLIYVSTGKDHRTKVIGFGGIAAASPVIVGDGDLAGVTDDGGSQLAAGICRAVQQIRHDFACFQSRHPGLHDPTCMVGSPRKGEVAGAVENQHYRFSCCGYGFQKFLLNSRETQVAAVFSFPAGDIYPSAVSAAGHDNHVAVPGRLDCLFKTGGVISHETAAFSVVNLKPAFQLSL